MDGSYGFLLFFTTSFVSRARVEMKREGTKDSFFNYLEFREGRGKEKFNSMHENYSFSSYASYNLTIKWMDSYYFLPHLSFLERE